MISTSPWRPYLAFAAAHWVVSVAGLYFWLRWVLGPFAFSRELLWIIDALGGAVLVLCLPLVTPLVALGIPHPDGLRNFATLATACAANSLIWALLANVTVTRFRSFRKARSSE